MIHAAEALKLESAALNESAQKDVQEMLENIDRFVRLNMRRSGCVMQINHTNSDVVLEVSRLLAQDGWATQWTPIAEQSRVSGSQPRHVGFQLTLRPKDEIYKADSLLH
jgi:hypothetical protein